MAEAGAARLADLDVEARLARLDEVLEELQSAPGPATRSATEAVRLLTEVYGEALARVLDRADAPLAERLADDELLGHLLVLHDIHPEPPELRAARAVERLRPAVRDRGGDVEWAGVDGDVARVRLTSGGGCGSGCGGGGGDVSAAVREAVLAVAPELTAVEPLPDTPAPAFVPLTTEGALARLIRSSADRTVAAEAEVCDLCAAPVADEHAHLYDTGHAEVRCVCGPCSVLFAEARAGEGHYRLVPRRRVRLPRVDTAVLGVPVGLVFFVPRADGAVTAQGPSPAGAMRWEVDAAAWQRLAGTCPQLATVEPEVEALLVNTVHGLDHHWIVPIDDCYRMVAVVRREWRGLSGGGRVWPAVEQFFEDLTERP